MAQNQYGLGFVFSAKDQASAVIRKIEGNLGSLGQSAQSVAKGITAAFMAMGAFKLSIASTEGLGRLAEDAARFEQRLGVLKATAGKDGKDYGAVFKEAALRSGLTTLYDPTAAVEGMTALAKAGMGAKDVLDNVGAALRLATASQKELNVEQSANFIAQVRATFADHPPDSNSIINVAAKLANDTLADWKEIPGLISRASRGTQGMKQSFTDTAAALSTIRDVITQGDRAATALGSIMQRLSGAKIAGQLKSLSGVDVRDGAGGFKSVLLVMGELAESKLWNRIDYMARQDLLKKMFGTYQIAAVEAMMAKVEKGVTNAQGVLVHGAEAAKAILASYARAKDDHIIDAYEIENIKSGGGLLDFLATKVRTVKLLIGDAFLPALKTVTMVLNTGLRIVGELLLAIPMPIKVGVATMLLLAGAVATVVTGLTAAVAGAMALSAILGVLGLELAPLIFWPLAGFLVVFGGLATAGLALWAVWKENIGGFRDTIGGFVDKAVLGARVLGQLFQKGGTWGDVDKQIMSPENSGLADFLMNIWLWIGRIKNFASGMWDGFKEGLKSIDGPIQVLMQVLRDLFALFGVSVGTVQENKNAFRDWGETGKAVGEVMAQLANAGIMVLAAAIELLAEIIQIVQAFLPKRDANGGFHKLAETAHFAANIVRGDFAGAAAVARSGAYWDTAGSYVEEAEAHPERKYTERKYGFLEARDLHGGDLDYWRRYGARARAEGWDPLQGRDHPYLAPANPGLTAAQVQADQANAYMARSQEPPQFVFAPTLQSTVKVNDQTLAEALQKTIRNIDSRSYQNAPAVAHGTE